MNALATLIKREYWENRGSFFKLPVIFAGFLIMIGTIYLGLYTAGVVHYNMNGQVDFIASIPPNFSKAIFYAMSWPFCVILFLVVFYYFLGSLYDDRKDRSILFWRSMPISEWQTIISKAIAGMVVAPLCVWACMVAFQFIFLIIISIAAAITHIPNIGSLWNPITLIGAWLHILGAFYMQMLWLFPLLSWCLLSSAYAKKSPFLTAMVPLIVVAIIEIIFYHHSGLIIYVFSRFSHAIHSLTSLLSKYPSTTYLNSTTYSIGSMYWSLAIGIALMYIAGFLRYTCFRADD